MAEAASALGLGAALIVCHVPCYCTVGIMDRLMSHPLVVDGMVKSIIHMIGINTDS